MRELNVKSVRAVERAIQILNCFSFDRPDLTIEEIIEKTKLAKATAYRLLWTLERNGLIHYDPKENTYRLGYKSLEYGGIVLENLDIRREAAPYLLELHDKSKHSAVLAVPQEDTIQYLLRHDSDEGFQPRNFVGRRRVLHNGAFGIVLLAYKDEDFVNRLLDKHPLEQLTPNTLTDREKFIERLREIRKKGYFIDVGGHFLGFTAIAAPVFNSTEEAIAAVGISGPSFKMEGDMEPMLVRLVKDTAKKISLRMGYIANGS